MALPVDVSSLQDSDGKLLFAFLIWKTQSCLPSRWGRRCRSSLPMAANAIRPDRIKIRSLTSSEQKTNSAQGSELLRRVQVPRALR